MNVSPWVFFQAQVNAKDVFDSPRRTGPIFGYLPMVEALLSKQGPGSTGVPGLPVDVVTERRIEFRI